MFHRPDIWQPEITVGKKRKQFSLRLYHNTFRIGIRYLPKDLYPRMNTVEVIDQNVTSGSV